jgi:hypothetical protein
VRRRSSAALLFCRPSGLSRSEKSAEATSPGVRSLRNSSSNIGLTWARPVRLSSAQQTRTLHG